VSEERFLVSGALGCIGAWTIRALAREGTPVVAFDLGRDHRRLAQIMSEEELAKGYGLANVRPFLDFLKDELGQDV